MNSMTSTQPAMNGPTVSTRIGFRIRKPSIVILYQTGECPRKFLRSASAIV